MTFWKYYFFAFLTRFVYVLVSCIQVNIVPSLFCLSLPFFPLIPLLSHGGKLGCFTAFASKMCLLTTVRQILYYIAEALSSSVQFRTWVNVTPCRSVQKVVSWKCLKDQNDIYEWVLGTHCGSLIDFEQEMGQWSLMLRSSTLTSVITSGLFVSIYI